MASSGQRNLTGKNSLLVLPKNLFHPNHALRNANVPQCQDKIARCRAAQRKNFRAGGHKVRVSCAAGTIQAGEPVKLAGGIKFMRRRIEEKYYGDDAQRGAGQNNTSETRIATGNFWRRGVHSDGTEVPGQILQAYSQDEKFRNQRQTANWQPSKSALPAPSPSHLAFCACALICTSAMMEKIRPRMLNGQPQQHAQEIMPQTKPAVAKPLVLLAGKAPVFDGVITGGAPEKTRCKLWQQAEKCPLCRAVTQHRGAIFDAALARSIHGFVLPLTGAIGFSRRCR